MTRQRRWQVGQHVGWLMSRCPGCHRPHLIAATVIAVSATMVRIHVLENVDLGIDERNTWVRPERLQKVPLW